MIKIKNLLLLNDKVPIRLIKEPYCIKCMNPVDQDDELCNSCTELPHQEISDWYFNRIVSLGVYKTYKNEGYNNIPLNVISRMILRLKGTVQKHKTIIGQLFADGLIKLIKKNSFLFRGLTYILIPPKDDPKEENQCKYFLNPFIDKINQLGYEYEDITSKLKRIKSIGKNREKSTAVERFKDIRGVHTLNDIDLQGKNVLILDDVITSKSTIWDISRELKEKNAGEINVLSLGRTLLSDDDMEENVYTDLNFYELLTYFSNLNNVLELGNIEGVKINESVIEDNFIECRVGKYTIQIDFENKKLKHDCIDYNSRRRKNKSFCKHIIKSILHVNHQYGEEYARDKLFRIYTKLLDWDFI